MSDEKPYFATPGLKISAALDRPGRASSHGESDRDGLVLGAAIVG